MPSTDAARHGTDRPTRFEGFEGLADLRILVVEDEYLIASEMALLLGSVGATVEGPWPTAREALAAVEALDGAIDAAVLDVNLGEGDRGYRVADRLEVLGIPYVFTTGYTRTADDPAYQDRPRLEKPILARALLRTLASLCAPRRRSVVTQS